MLTANELDKEEDNVDAQKDQDPPFVPKRTTHDRWMGYAQERVMVR